MMSFEPMISRLSVEAFRGFRDAREFDLFAEGVVLTGPNGTGKTSFFDAIQWGLLGTIERLETFRARRNVEHIVNQYRLGRKASVEIDLLVSSGLVTVRRTGDQGGSTLELRRMGCSSLFGEEAEAELRNILLPHSALTLDSALTTSGLMQQDVMRRVLEAKPADRYRQLSTVLGLAALEDFEDAARSVAKQASDREKDARATRVRLSEALGAARARSDSAQALMSGRPQIAAVREEALAVLAATPPGVTLSVAGVTLRGPEDVRLMATAFGRAADVVESVRAMISESSRLRAGLAGEPTQEELTILRVEVASREADSAAAAASRVVVQEQLDAARRAAADVAQLAALAIPMLTDDCPVCGQRIDRDHVERQLRERAEATGAILDLQGRLGELTAEHRRAEAAAAMVRETLAMAEQQVGRWRQFRDAEIEARAVLAARIEDIGVLRFESTDPEWFAQVASPALEYIHRARRRLLDFLGTLDRQSDQGPIDRAAAEISSLENALDSAGEQLAAESARSHKLEVLFAQTLKARVEVTEARLRSIQPLVADIYQRLDPHPAFKTVEFELDTYYRKGTTTPLVVDQVENVSADPLLIFSTSQANIVALSYFIAMSLSAGERGLPFLLLDDPVQSMDDVNVLGFADLCRHLRNRRQLIVSTHERRFASLLERKLAPRSEGSRTKMIRFTGWDRSGPTVSEHFVDAQLLDDPIRLVHAS